MIRKGTRALVTGGGGFIGSHLCEELLERGATVVTVDQGYAQPPPPDVVRVTRDLIRDGIEDLLEEHRPEIIFHLSANAYVPPSVEDPIHDYEANLDTTVRMLDGLRRSPLDPLFLYASSAAVYGDPAGKVLSEESPLDPMSPYGVSKMAAERYVAVYAQLYGVRATTARFFSVYGPRQRKQVVFDLIEKLSANPEELEILGDGTQTRDLNYVGDTVEGLLCVAERSPHRGEAFNIASGRSVEIKELAQAIAHAMELRPRFRFTGSVRAGDPERWEADIGRLQALGYRPATTLAAGLHRTVAWYRSLRPEEH